MRSRFNELVSAGCVVIDDLGKEPRKYYGNDDNTFLELCEASAHGGPLLIIATGLSTSPVVPRDPRYPMSIQERYGMEVLDRLRTVTTTTVYSGASLRR